MLYSFSGVKEREWIFETTITFAKPVGGPPGGEGLLVGHANGEVHRIFVNNPFAIKVLSHGAPITGLDLSK